jgi:hypothetical protein
MPAGRSGEGSDRVRKGDDVSTVEERRQIRDLTAPPQGSSVGASSPALNAAAQRGILAGVVATVAGAVGYVR